MRWDAKSKDAKELQGMFTRGLIAVDAKAHLIREANPLWLKNYTADQFRNAFNRYKKQHELVTAPSNKGNG
jgi:hypothetical protein